MSADKDQRIEQLKSELEKERARKEWLAFSKIVVLPDGSSVMFKNHLEADEKKDDGFIAKSVASVMPSMKLRVRVLVVGEGLNNVIDAALAIQNKECFYEALEKPQAFFH